MDIEEEIEMPVGAIIVKVHDGEMWAVIPDTSAGTEKRTFTSIGTGWDVPENSTYWGTWFQHRGDSAVARQWVWHLVELRGKT